MINHQRRHRCWHRSGAFAQGLAQRGHEVTLMHIAETEHWRFRESEREGVRIVECPDLTVGRLRSGWDPVCGIRRMRWLSRREGRYDVVHLFETRPATILPGLFVSRRKRLPLVIDWNDWWGNGGLITINRPLWYRFLFGRVETFFEEHYRVRADATTVISHGLAARAARLGVPRESITHLRPGIDPTRFNVQTDLELRRLLGFADEDVVLGYSSQDTFFDIAPVLEGAEIAVKQGFRLKLLVLGQYAGSFPRDLRKHGLENAVHLAGFVSNEDYPRYLSAMDFMVTPFKRSNYNLGRWPNKFGDYLATGRPIVFNAFGDLAEFAVDPPGIVCEFGSDAFAEAFAALCADPSVRQRLGARARELALFEFRWEDRIDTLEQVYAGAIDEHRRKAARLQA
jgi:glycosyltransferase involved in cell wall biosynthesis